MALTDCTGGCLFCSFILSFYRTVVTIPMEGPRAEDGELRAESGVHVSSFVYGDKLGL